MKMFSAMAETQLCKSRYIYHAPYRKGGPVFIFTRDAVFVVWVLFLF